MKCFRNIYIPIFIIFILSLIPLVWFKNSCVIAGGDINQYMSVLKFVQSRFYYLHNENMGQYSFAWIGLMPSMGIFWWLFKSIGLIDTVIQRFWFVFVWFFSMWGMYLLIKEIAGSKYSKTGAIIGAFLYTVNIFNGSMALNFIVSLTFLVLPYLMLVTIRAIRNSQKENMNVLYFALIILFGAVILINPGYSYIAFLLPVLYILYSMFYAGSVLDILRKLKLILKLLFISIISTSFVIWSYFYTMRDVSEEMTTMVRGGFFGANSLQEAFRFLASWAFRASHYKLPYNPWAHNYYSSSWVVFASFLIPVIVFAGLVFQKKFKKDILFFCLISFLGLFLSKGAGQPFGTLYEWAFEHIPMFVVFREPWSKFTQITVFSFSILLGLGFTEIKENIGNIRLKNIFIFVFVSIIICSVVIAAFPIFSGRIISPYWNGSVKGNYIKVPDYWNETAEYLKLDGFCDTVFLTPRSPLSIHEWARGVSTMHSVPSLLLDNPIIRYDENICPGKEMLHLVYGLIEPKTSYEFSKLLKLMGVRYILQQNDIDWRFLPSYTYSPEIMERILKQQGGLEKIKSIGELDIYKVYEENFLPEIYIADNCTLVYGRTREIPKFLFTNFLDRKPLFNFIDLDSQDSPINNPFLYDNIVLVDKEWYLEDIGKNVTLIYNFNEEEFGKMTRDIPEGKYTLKMAYNSREQKEIISNIKYNTIAPVSNENKRIGFLELNFMNLEKPVPDFTIKPILANWEYGSFCRQVNEKELVLESFNDIPVNVDLCIRFKYYWNGTVKVFNGNTNKFIREVLLDDYSDFLELKDFLVEPGKNYFKILCIPAKTDKNWSGEQVNVQKDIGIKISGRAEPLEDQFRIKDKLILETYYDLTVFNGVKQIDLLFYLDSDGDNNVDAWLQVTMDDWMMQQDFNHFKTDIMQAMEERFNCRGYNIMAADMICYPSKGGEIRERDDRIAGDVILKDFSIIHIYYPSYTFSERYLRNTFDTHNMLEGCLYAEARQISGKGCYPLIVEAKGVSVQDKGIAIDLPEDKILSLKWLMFIPEDESIGHNKVYGTVKNIKRISPVMYKARVEVNEPCFIVLSKNFHSGWKTFITNINGKNNYFDKFVLTNYLKDKFIGKREIDNHIEVNGYANAWYLDSRDIDEIKNGNKEILFIYYPQLIHESGILISIIFFITGIVYILCFKYKVKIVGRNDGPK